MTTCQLKVSVKIDMPKTALVNSGRQIHELHGTRTGDNGEKKPSGGPIISSSSKLQSILIGRCKISGPEKPARHKWRSINERVPYRVQLKCWCRNPTLGPSEQVADTGRQQHDAGRCGAQLRGGQADLGLSHRLHSTQCAGCRNVQAPFPKKKKEQRKRCF